MNNRKKQIKIKITKREREKVEEFADLRSENVEVYKKRGSFKRSDIVVGGMAEIAAYKLLRQHGFKVTYPDFKIYENERKSYDADLTDYNRHFHVKGQSLESTQKYGASWLLQRRDPLIRNPEPKNYLVPCTVDDMENTVTIYGIIPFKSLVDNHCVGECQLEWFRKTKVAIYLDHIFGVMSWTSRWGILKDKKRGRI